MLSFNLRQHVTSSTHKDGNLLDLIFDQESDDDFITAVKVSPVPFSDHYLIEADLSVVKEKKPLLKVKKRRLNKLDLESFRTGMLNKKTFQNPASDVDAFVDQFEGDVTRILDEMVPEQTCTKSRSSKTHCWLSAAAMEAKRVRRRLERRWIHTQREEDRVAYRKSCCTANKLITDSLKAKNTEVKGICQWLWYGGESCSLGGDEWRRDLMVDQFGIFGSLIDGFNIGCYIGVGAGRLGENVWRMIWMSWVYTLNGWCSGICGEASNREKRLTLAEHGRNGRFLK